MYNFVTLCYGEILNNLTLILLAAGSSTRFGLNTKKQWLRIDHQPLWLAVAKNFEKTNLFDKIIITSSAQDIEFMKNYADYEFIEGGSTRQESLKNALVEVDSEFVMVSDIARCCVDEQLLLNILSHKQKADSIVPYLDAKDTIVYGDKTINRDEVKIIQTPQLSKTKILKDALLNAKEDFSDESSAIVASGGLRYFVLGSEDAHKLTHLSDLKKLPCLNPPSKDMLNGIGFDVHAFDDKGSMYLGGIKIDSEFGFKAHSDGDVALHALIDALLGAAGMGDIGMLFPDNDPTYKGIDSKELLKDVVKKLHGFGFNIVNVDLTIACEKPKLSPYKTNIRQTIAAILQIEASRVNIKASTTEKLGFVGRGEGVAVFASANLKYFDWMDV